MKRTFIYMLTAVALFAASCTPDCCGVNTKEAAVIPDSVKVSVEVAKHYVKNYASHAGYVDSTAASARGITTQPETRCIWFSKARLSQLLCQLEKEEGDGIRFYLMTYNDTYAPDDKKFRPIPPPDHWGYNTLLMVSTKDSTIKGQSYHWDYYSEMDTKLSGVKPGFIIDLVPENRGEICPPPSNCQDTGATLIEN